MTTFSTSQGEKKNFDKSGPPPETVAYHCSKLLTMCNRIEFVHEMIKTASVVDYIGFS